MDMMFFQGTVNVMSSDPPCNARFTTVVHKILYLINNVEKISFIFVNSNMFFCIKNTLFTFVRKPQLKDCSLQNYKH